MSDLRKLRELMRSLRAPEGGCPWDLEQSFATIVPHTLEEAYEVADVIENGRLEDLPEELGDLLFQIVFYCELGEEAARFTLDDVVHALERKLIERHPHVFGTAVVGDSAAVAGRWEAHKAAARQARASTRAASELDDVPPGFPALVRANKLQKRAARVGFDWPDVTGAWAKLVEEVAELEAAAGADQAAEVSAELGDLLFSAVNVARHLGHDAEASLRAANARFERRFRYVEAALAGGGVKVEAADAGTLDRLWEQAKDAGL